MKVPYSWLTEIVPVPWDARELGSRLTMAGFELDALEPAGPEFCGVIVGEILAAERHPQADRLQVCRVDVGRGETLSIVCGAANARAGLKSALATVGAKLPGGVEIRATQLRGVDSQGMLASAKELGLAESSAGILELPADAPVGMPLREYLSLDEPVLDLAVTPNRGDAMSVIGIAREVAALSAGKLKSRAPVEPSAAERGTATAMSGATLKSSSATSTSVPPSASATTFPVRVDAPAACPVFAGCVIRGVDNRSPSPMWMRERLRRAGVRSISPVVDVTNYVMLELGQPMHAYDLAKLKGGIVVRFARDGESITLLDGKTLEMQPDVLLITDGEGPVALASIMGGQRTAVSLETTEVLLESAFFSPEAVAGRARRWGYVTDASQRFERGVDPTQQRRAIQRAIELLRPIAGGEPGPLSVVEAPESLPRRMPVELRRAQLNRLLGTSIADARVTATLADLQMQVEDTRQGWRVTPPPHRFDIAIEPDLIEEVARIVGFDSIPQIDAIGPQQFHSLPEERPPEQSVLEALVAQGYQEQITFAFVDPQLQASLFPHSQPLTLSNAIASDLSVMRLSLWPGLLKVARENQRRQQDRVRLFEHGARFAHVEGTTHEIDSLAALALGARLPEQWGLSRDQRVPVDFFDMKGDLEALLIATGARAAFEFDLPGTDVLDCLHPGRAARIRRDGQAIGWIGELHPALVRQLDFTYPPVLFELDMAALRVEKPQFHEISRFPQVRRDLAIIVDESLSLSALAERVTLAASSLLQSVRIFDVYRGPGVETGRKSVALGLIFQDISRTLTDDEVERLMSSLMAELRATVNARIRE